MTHKVSLTQNTYSVSIRDSKNYVVQEAKPVLKMGDLGDFNSTGLENNYIIMYNATTKTYSPVSPDKVLVVTSSGPAGLPTTFVNVLDTTLDNKVDLDAGGF